MKNKIKSFIRDTINLLKDKNLRRYVLAKLLKRVFVPIMWIVVCSNIGMLFLYAAPSINSTAILIAAGLYFVCLVRHIFVISFYRRHSQPYVIDVFIPWAVIAFLALVGYLVIPPSIFNYVLLPLRAMEPFFLRSWASIILVLILMLALMSFTRSIGRKTRIKREMKRRKDKEMKKFLDYRSLQ